MKRYLSNFFLLLIIGFLITPQMTLAAWWNPFTWKIFNRTSQPSTSVISDKSKVITKSVIPATKPAVSATELKKKDPEQYKNLVTENKTQLLEATKILSNKKIIARVKPSVVYIETTSGSGSGIVIGSDGYVLTNAHVVTSKNSAIVKLADGRSFNGTVIGRDENIDLALLKIATTGLIVAFLGDSDSVEQGDPVFTFGYPFGIEGDVNFKDGTLSRRQKIDGTTYLEISAQILPGSSGGPLVNQAGEVIGVNTLAIGASKVGGVLIGETLKFALPINLARGLIPELKNGRNVVIPKTSIITQEPIPTLLLPKPYIPPAIITPVPIPSQPQPTPITPPTPAPIPTPKPPAPLPVPVIIPQASTGGTLFRFKLSDGDYVIKSLTFSKAIVGGDPLPTVVGMSLGYQLANSYVLSDKCGSGNTVQSPIRATYNSLNEIKFVFPQPTTCKVFGVDIQTENNTPTSYSIQYNLIGGELETLTDNLTVPAPQYSATINYGTPSPSRIFIWSSGKIAKAGQVFDIQVQYLKNGKSMCDVPITYSGPDLLEKVENTVPKFSYDTGGECFLLIRYTPITLGVQAITIKAQGLAESWEIEVKP